MTSKTETHTETQAVVERTFGEPLGYFTNRPNDRLVMQWVEVHTDFKDAGRDD